MPGDNYGYFILLTSKSEKNDIAMGLEAGADDFLTKPVDANELRARIAAGERILKMQRELTHKNRLITETLDELQRLVRGLGRLGLGASNRDRDGNEHGAAILRRPPANSR